ncbi:MAG: HD domain-containing protein [Thermoplasmatales archaeon]|nr:MAG: HD domain-containing protein [Thermoplasmatales archaeon]
MNSNVKIIRDPIHGDIKLEGFFLDLIETPEIQRLYNIKQLGFTHLVFPGAHHTRLEHSLGAYYLAFKASDSLKFDNDEKNLIACSAILHDIGHGPFSHTLESILRNSLNVDHVDLTEKLILGEYAIFDNCEKNIINPFCVFDVLSKYNINHKEVIKIIRGISQKKNYLSQLLNSTIDVDQLDYIIRDAYYTGVSYGMIDIERFLQTLVINNNNLAVQKKGIGVIENILMARTLMYSSVYFHKTVRIAELMLSKAIELMDELDPFEIFKMTEGELMNFLRNKDTYQCEIATRLKYRKLFKQAFAASKSDLVEDNNEIIKKLDDKKFKRGKEKEFEEKLDIPEGHIIIDVPYTDLHLSEPRIDQTDIGILVNDKIKKFDDYTPVGQAVKTRDISDWDIMIITDEKNRDIVSKKAEKILFN